MKQKCRLVLLTTDNAILAASQSYRVNNLIDSDQSTSTFYDLYVRHPRAFMDADGVLSIGSADRHKNEKTLFDWLQVLLLDGPLGDPSKFVLNQGMIESERFNDSTLAPMPEDLLSRVAERWRSMSHEFISIAGEPEILANLPKQATAPNVKEAISSALSKFDKQSADMRYEFIYVGNGARVTYQAAQNVAIPLREVKLPLFEGRPALSEFLQGLKTMFRSTPVDAPKIWNYVTEKDDAIRGEDAKINDGVETGYSQDMGFSYLMALLGQWRTAATLCRRALAHARAPDALVRSNGSNGREAWLFLAYCERHTAGNPAELDACAGYLDKAKQVADLEIEQFRASSHPWEHDVVAARIDAELLALKYQGLLIEWHNATEQDKPGILEKIRPIAYRYDAFKEVVEKEIMSIVEFSKNNPGVIPPPELAPIGERLSIRRNLLVRADRNILAIGLLESRPPDNIRAMAKKSWNKLKEFCVSAEWQFEAEPRSRFSRLIMLCGQARFSENSEERRFARQSLAEVKGQYDESEGQIYDVMRNREMIRLAS